VELTLKGIVQVFGEWVQEVSYEDDSPEGWFRRGRVEEQQYRRLWGG
jgi:hypothetical protein